MQRYVPEELVNSVTHGVGLALSIAGLCLMMVLAGLHADAWTVVACAIYGGTLVILYAASTLYHGLQGTRLKGIFRIIDHACIFLFIAGTYTAFTLTVLRGGWGWTLFGLVWGFALLGISFKIVFKTRFTFASTLFYVLLGWLAIIAVKPLLEAMPLAGLLWLLAGGGAYTVGVVFYSLHKVPYFHAVWHLFVLAGSICHYVAVMFWVVSPTKP